MKRFGVANEANGATSALPFARAVEAGGWLYVSGQTPMRNGELIDGSIVAQTRQTLSNLVAVLHEAGYGVEDVVRCGVWLDDPRDFAAFNAVYREVFGAHPPARTCVVSGMVFDCKVEVDCIAFKTGDRHKTTKVSV